MSDAFRVDRLQQDIADRQPVDWDALLAELQESQPASADDLQEISLLRLLDEIGHAHSQFQTGTFGDEEPTTVVADHSPDATLEEWGRYRLERKVGRGGFGSVYRAWDPHLQMPVAIKILHRRYSDERLTERLLHEGQTLAKVRHHNVVRVLTVEENDGRLGLVMEFLSGETMDGLVEAKGPISYQDASGVVEDVCRALIEVHERGFIHCDVKARNIIREPDGRIVLMDFGAGLSATADQTGAAVGTPLYMAPETLTGAPATPASDVYGAGVLLFYLVTGRYPYEGQDIDDIRAAHASGQAQRLSVLRPDLPARFVSVVECALAVHVEDRYATPAALLDGLARARKTLKWTEWLYRTALLVVSIVMLMLGGGILSSAGFNLSFGRTEYATESVRDWFVLGRRALVLPMVLCLVGVLLVGLLLAARSILLPISAGVRSLDRKLRRTCGSVARRLSLTDESVCGSWLVLCSALGVAAIWMYFAPLLDTMSKNLSTTRVEELYSVVGAFLKHRTSYRISLTVLAAANVVSWYALRRAIRGRRIAMPTWVVGMELTVLVLLFVSMQLPYRLLNDHNKFAITTWQNQKCFVLGQRPQDALLFCPAMMPRVRIRQASEGPLVVSQAGESMFATFARRGQ